MTNNSRPADSTIHESTACCVCEMRVFVEGSFLAWHVANGKECRGSGHLIDGPVKRWYFDENNRAVVLQDASGRVVVGTS
jgi:hypothetical protein